MSMKNYKVITATSATELNRQIMGWIGQGWKPIGSHNVVTTHEQKRYAGSQHMDTIYKVEYSQTIVKKDKSNMIEYKPQITVTDE